MFLGNFLLYQLTDLLIISYFMWISQSDNLSHLSFFWLTQKQGRQRKIPFTRLKICMFNPTTSINLTTLPRDCESLNPGTTTATNISQGRLGLLVLSVQDSAGTANTNAYYYSVTKCRWLPVETAYHLHIALSLPTFQNPM